MRHLYLQIYITLVAILILFGALVFAAWHFLPASEEREKWMTGGAAVVSSLLPPRGADVAETDMALKRLHEQLGVDLSLYDERGNLEAAAGEPVPVPNLEGRETGWVRGGGKGPRVALHLTDGRWLIVRPHARRGGAWLGMLVILAIAVAVGAYPVVRRLTRRLERLQARVDQLGAGDLSARVQVQGSDEVARLAQSFNLAADRLEQLVEAQRGILAGASHELRTPLTRIRMGLELLAGEDNDALAQRVSRDIRDLDELIDELLLASRLSAGESLENREPLELLALAAEEGARAGAQVSGETTVVKGDARTLRRMLRNLFENARRHGGGTAIEANVDTTDTGLARIVVSDAGPGVPESERERIFMPFYRSPPDDSPTRESGVGLGLALVREIARRHGGDARCLPRDGGGSRFEVTLAKDGRSPATGA